MPNIEDIRYPAPIHERTAAAALPIHKMRIAIVSIKLESKSE